MATPHVGVVMLNYNGKALLQRFLPHLQNLTYSNYKIYVVDNASTDGSTDYLKETYPEITVLKNEENYGYAKGYNEALKRIVADYYLIINTDVEVSRGLLESLIAVLESDNAAAVCQPKILSLTNKAYFEYAGAAGGFIDKFGYPFARGRVFFTCEQDFAQYDATTEIFWASGSCFLIKAQYFHKVGGFYEYMFMQSEEIDLCWRIKQLGGKILYTSNASVFHLGGANLSYGSPEKNYLNFRNNWIMLYRNVPLKRFYRYILPQRLLLDVCASLYFLLKGNPKHFFTVYRAIYHFALWLFRYGKEDRQKTSSNFLLFTGSYHKSIVFDYFRRNKKKFSDLSFCL